MCVVVWQILHCLRFIVCSSGAPLILISSSLLLFPSAYPPFLTSIYSSLSPLTTLPSFLPFLTTLSPIFQILPHLITRNFPILFAQPFLITLSFSIFSSYLGLLCLSSCFESLQVAFSRVLGTYRTTQYNII